MMGIIYKTSYQRMKLVQGIIFSLAILTLSVLSYFNGSLEIKRPVVFLAASAFALVGFRKITYITILQRIILLYMIALCFNLISEKYLQFRGFSIHLPMIVIIPMAISFLCGLFRRNVFSSAETNDLLKSWGIVFGIIVFFMLFLWSLLQNMYGYGHGHDLAICANLCLYFLIFLFCWQLLEDQIHRRITGVIICVFCTLAMMEGF